MSLPLKRRWAGVTIWGCPRVCIAPWIAQRTSQSYLLNFVNKPISLGTAPTKSFPCKSNPSNFDTSPMVVGIVPFSWGFLPRSRLYRLVQSPISCGMDPCRFSFGSETCVKIPRASHWRPRCHKHSSVSASSQVALLALVLTVSGRLDSSPIVEK